MPDQNNDKKIKVDKSFLDLVLKTVDETRRRVSGLLDWKLSISRQVDEQQKTIDLFNGVMKDHLELMSNLPVPTSEMKFNIFFKATLSQAEANRRGAIVQQSIQKILNDHEVKYIKVDLKT